MVEPVKKLARIQRQKIEEALQQVVPAAVGHLDLEGIVYLKITRTGAQECFAADVTSEVLKKEGFDYNDQSKSFWQHPAMEKWGG